MKSAVLYSFLTLVGVFAVAVGVPPVTVTQSMGQKSSLNWNSPLRRAEGGTPEAVVPPLQDPFALRTDISPHQELHRLVQQNSESTESDVQQIESSAEKLRKSTKTLVKLLRSREMETYGYSEEPRYWESK